VVGEGVLFGDDGRWSEPRTTLLRSAQSRVSSGAPLGVACEDALTSRYSVATALSWKVHPASLSRRCRASLGALPRLVPWNARRPEFTLLVAKACEVSAVPGPLAELGGKAEGILAGGTQLATRRPATERSEGA